jgi:hypothetical protein
MSAVGKPEFRVSDKRRRDKIRESNKLVCSEY